ncbi:hypothetical protein HY468_02560 [Candidatus Roizmanbacteria bacterium]|nr:hypothetical protein [Candidatus Roizmanbacteria bacterium]
MKYTHLFIFLLTVSSFLILSVRAANAAILTLDPATFSQESGNTFDVNVTIDTEGETITSSDVVLTYDSSHLQITEVVNGARGGSPFFPEMYHTISNNELYVAASVSDPTEVVSGQGVVITVTFQGITGGATDVMFDCTTGKTSDTNINKSDKNATDIVDCARLTQGRYTIGSGIGAPNPTQPPSVPYVPPSPTPTIPVSGSGAATIPLIGVGIFLTMVGITSKVILKL